MTVSEEFILTNVKTHNIVQLINKEKDVTVTFRMKNGLVFVTNCFDRLPVSCYLNFDDIQSKLSTEEIEKCVKKAIREGGWSFKFHNINI